MTIEALAQEYAGPAFAVAFASRYSPDAESYILFMAVTPEQLNLDYPSTGERSLQIGVAPAAS